MNLVRLRWGFVFLLMQLFPAALFSKSLQLANHGLAVEIDEASGAITSITNRLTNDRQRVRTLPWRLETNNSVISPTVARGFRSDERSAWFEYEQDKIKTRLTYTIPADSDWMEAALEVTNSSPEIVTLQRITTADIEFTPGFHEVHPHRDPNLWENLINLFLRTERGGLFLGIENPIYTFWSDGNRTDATHIGLAFEPRWRLSPGETFRCEPMFIGAYRKEGIYLFRETQNLRRAIRTGKNQPSAMALSQELLDWGEVWAMQSFMRALQPPVEFKHPGYYVRAVGMVGGNKQTDQTGTAAAHIEFEPQHVAGSKRFVDDVARLGHVQHIEWATEWFGVGGYAKATRDFQLERVGPGEDMPVNPHWREVADYTRKAGMGIGIFETVVRDFARDKAEWKVMHADGPFDTFGGLRAGKLRAAPWKWQPDQATNCWANPEYVDWRIAVTDRAITDHELYMVAWDAALPAYWMWHGWPERHTICLAENHGHPPGNIEYHLFRSISRFIAELHRRHPKVALRVACGTTPGYPWILKDLIEYHPNLYDGETGATYWSSYNFRFLPMYKSGVLLSAETHDAFQYLLLRSLSCSDHLMLWPDAVPIALRNQEFWNKWLSWADHNIKYLRSGRTLFREPWGDCFVASLPPALEGSLPADDARIHGTAHCVDDGGYVFLFNPSSGSRTASFVLNHWLGLTRGEAYSLAEIFPKEQTLGICRLGGEIFVTLPPGSAVIVSIRSSAAAGQARIGAPPTDGTAIDKAFLSWDELPWSELMARP
jgi:hypothetical protein